MNKPHRIFAEVVDPKAMAQFDAAMSQDWVVRGAIMPDVHAGYTLPVGSVVATAGVVVPSYVGYDIGCGLLSIRTSFKLDDVRKHAQEIFNGIYASIPVGFRHNDRPHQWDGLTTLARSEALDKIIAERGTNDQVSLGQGNHFHEIGFDETGAVWITIHSGSRNLGHTVASHYMALAADAEKAVEGHFPLRVDSQEGRDYITDLAFALEYALENRLGMAKRIGEVMHRELGYGDLEMDSLVNRNHNHAEERNETDEKGYTTGRKVWIHRKGATHAEEGMLGVIPGNMRDGVFLVRGKGNPESLFSSSHGAGRVMGRKQAERVLDLEAFRLEMAERGVVARVEQSTLDESAAAYKNIWEVMAMQKDLVEVIHHITPMINIKG